MFLYHKLDLTEFVSGILNDFLDCYPNKAMLCSRDVNYLELLSIMSCLTALVHFSTQGVATIVLRTN